MRILFPLCALCLTALAGAGELPEITLRKATRAQPLPLWPNRDALNVFMGDPIVLAKDRKDILKNFHEYVFPTHVDLRVEQQQVTEISFTFTRLFSREELLGAMGRSNKVDAETIMENTATEAPLEGYLEEMFYQVSFFDGNTTIRIRKPPVFVARLVPPILQNMRSPLGIPAIGVLKNRLFDSLTLFTPEKDAAFPIPPEIFTFPDNIRLSLQKYTSHITLIRSTYPPEAFPGLYHIYHRLWPQYEHKKREDVFSWELDSVGVLLLKERQDGKETTTQLSQWLTQSHRGR